MNTQKSLVYQLAEVYERHRTRRCASASEGARPRQSSRLGRVLRWFVPNGGTLLLAAALVLTANVWAKPLANPAAPGPSATTVNYQGRLADSGGTPLDGTYGMTFSLYDAPSGGSLVWGPESHTAVPVNDGLFSVGLGSQTGGSIPTSTWNGDRYLEITVGGETLSPRELIRSVPIAGMALTLPDHTVDGTMLASTGFGTSSTSLRNFVIRDPVVDPDLTDTTEVAEAVWDLSPIIGDSAEMVLLYVRLQDDAVKSHFQAWPNGESRIFTTAPFVRVFQANMSHYDVIWVRCDSNQTIKYMVNAEGSGNTELSALQVTVIGWVEPATTP